MVPKTNVLLVEDNRKQVDAFLNNTPPNIHLFAVATTYKEYLEMVNKEEWALIITDLFFPYSKDPKENEVMNKNLWKLVLESSLKYHIGNDCMRGFRSWKEGRGRNYKVVNSPVEKETWDELHAHGMLSSFEKVGFENLYKNYFGKDKDFPKKGTAPWGFEIFTDLYFKRKIPVVLQTSDCAHSTIGSPILMLMQHYGLDNFQHIPFLSLDGRDFRLSQTHKPSDIKYIVKIMHSGMILSKLKNLDFYEMNSAITAIIILDRKIMSMNDLIEKGFFAKKIYETEEKKIISTRNRIWGKKDIEKDLCEIRNRIEEIKKQGADPYVNNFLKECPNHTLREYYEKGVEILRRVFPPK